MAMRIGGIAVCAVACLVLIAWTAPDAPAAPETGVVLAGSDLVVQEIVIRAEGAEEFHNVRVGVRVRNRGGANAGASMTALIYSADVAAGSLVLTQATPAIAGGSYRDLEFTLEGIAGKFAGVLLAIADAPVAGHSYGQVREGSGISAAAAVLQPLDLNNTFGVICTTAGRSLPLRFQNPGL